MPPKSNQKTAGKHFAELCNFIKDKCSEIKEENVSVEDTLEALNARINRDTDKLSESEKTATNVMFMLMPVIDALTSYKRDDTLQIHETKINRLQAGMRNNEYATDALAQYSRRENVRISGVAEPPGNEDIPENFTDILTDIGNSMGVRIDPGAIVDVHRLGKKTPNKQRQIIVRFSNRMIRRDFIVNRRKLKQSEKFKGVFISDDLTPLRFKLFQMVRKHDDVKSAHTRDGKIVCIMKSGTKVILESPDDLFRIGIDEVDFPALGLNEL